MESKFIPFAPWRPDQPDFANPGSPSVVNAMRVATGYIPISDLVEISSTVIPGEPTMLAYYKDNQNNSTSWIGTRTHLYQVDTDFSLIDRTNPAHSAVVLASTDRYNHASFEDILAPADNFYVCAIGLPIQVWNPGAATFLDLGTNAPEAKYMATVRNFLMAANIVDPVDGRRPRRISWGPIQNPNGDWTPDPQTQADFQDLQDVGDISGITGGDYATVICENGIVRGNYTGGAKIWRFDTLEIGNGCTVPGSIIKVNNLTYYLSNDGWRVFDGIQSQPFGAEIFDRWFKTQLNVEGSDFIYAANMDDLNSIMWSFTGQNSGGVNNTVLYYNYVINEPSSAQLSLQVLGQYGAPGYTMDNMDALWPTNEGLPYPLDDVFYKGGKPQVTVIAENKLFSMSGAPLPATVVTAEDQPSAPFTTTAKGVQLIAENPDADKMTTVRIGTRKFTGDAIDWSTPGTRNNAGWFPRRKGGRYHRIQVDIGSPWTSAQGVNLLFDPSGMR